MRPLSRPARAETAVRAALLHRPDRLKLLPCGQACGGYAKMGPNLAYYMRSFPSHVSPWRYRCRGCGADHFISAQEFNALPEASPADLAKEGVTAHAGDEEAGPAD